ESFDHQIRIKLRYEDLHRALPGANKHADRLAINMEIWNHEEITLMPPFRKVLRPERRLDGIGVEVEMREHRALGRSRRTSGVLKDGNVFFGVDLHPGKVNRMLPRFLDEAGQGEGASHRRPGCVSCRIFCKTGNNY